MSDAVNLPESNASSNSEAPPSAPKRRWGLIIGGIILGICLIGGLIFWIISRSTPYDDFSEAGKGLDDTKWIPLANVPLPSECKFERADGVGILSNELSDDNLSCILEAKKPRAVPLNKLGYIEADMYATGDATGLDTLGIEITDYMWYSSCGLDFNAYLGEYQASMIIASLDSSAPEQIYVSDVTAQEWHRIRLEVDPEKVEISCYVDDHLLGRHIPGDVARLRNSQFRYLLVSIYEAGSTGTYWIDNINMAPK